MATRITDQEMTSDRTRHSGRASADGGWVVTWLPGRVLTRSQAVTAMTLAGVLAVCGPVRCDDPMWLRIGNWAAELGISGLNAVARVSFSPGDPALRSAWPSWPERAAVGDDADTGDSDPDDGLEPCCTVCGEYVGIFYGHGEDWHHFRGEGTAGSPVELVAAGHVAVVGWFLGGGQ